MAQVTRACLKNHSCNLHAPLCGIFYLRSVDVARYAALIQEKSPTNCDAHLAESFFQTRSKASKASEANMFYYPVRFSQKEVLARTSYNITGSWTTNKTGNWKSTRIQVDNDRGIIKSGVIAHEIGHAFGLSHRITNKNSIMCQTQYGRKVQTVQNTDWETFKHIYGY